MILVLSLPSLMPVNSEGLPPVPFAVPRMPTSHWPSAPKPVIVGARTCMMEAALSSSPKRIVPSVGDDTNM